MERKNPTKVIVVIGDVVASRSIAEREGFQTGLDRTLKMINSESRPASSFTVSAGDEIEAVYLDGATLFFDLLTIMAAIYPHRIRFAVAVGTITTDIHPNNPLVMDGPAFHLARKGVTELRAAKESLRVTAEPPTDVALENDAARLLAHHVGQWKQTRWDVYRQLVRGATPAAASRSLQISSVAVYKNIRAGTIDLVRDLARDMGRSLSAKVVG